MIQMISISGCAVAVTCLLQARSSKIYLLFYRTSFPLQYCGEVIFRKQNQNRGCMGVILNNCLVDIDIIRRNFEQTIFLNNSWYITKIGTIYRPTRKNRTKLIRFVKAIQLFREKGRLFWPNPIHRTNYNVFTKAVQKKRFLIQFPSNNIA